MRTCTNCGTPVGDAVFFCLSCGNRQKIPGNSMPESRVLTEEPAHGSVPPVAHAASFDNGYGDGGVQFEKRQIAGLVGTLLLFMGTFCPAFSATILAASVSVNFLNGGRGDGRYLIGLAVIAAAFTFFKRYWFTLAGGATALLIIVIDVVDASNKFGSTTALVSYDWGIGVLVLGSMIMMSTPFVPQRVLKRAY